MPGDALLPDASGQLTDAITIHAPPEAIWPWLVQMGSGRGGFYSIDLLDNANRASAREIHPELQEIGVGDVLPARPGHADGFEVLALEEPRALVLGGLYDGERQLPFAAPRPAAYSHVTWAFALEPIDGARTRLLVRVRAALAKGTEGRLAWIGPVHRLMEAAQLRNLAARIEGRVHRSDWRDLVDGAGGAARVLAALFAPHRRARARTGA
jgi:proline iminopeptidase